MLLKHRKPAMINSIPLRFKCNHFILQMNLETYTFSRLRVISYWTKRTTPLRTKNIVPWSPDRHYGHTYINSVSKMYERADIRCNISNTRGSGRFKNGKNYVLMNAGIVAIFERYSLESKLVDVKVVPLQQTIIVLNYVKL